MLNSNFNYDIAENNNNNNQEEYINQEYDIYELLEKVVKYILPCAKSNLIIDIYFGTYHLVTLISVFVSMFIYNTNKLCTRSNIHPFLLLCVFSRIIIFDRFPNFKIFITCKTYFKFCVSLLILVWGIYELAIPCSHLLQKYVIYYMLIFYVILYFFELIQLLYTYSTKRKSRIHSSYRYFRTSDEGSINSFDTVSLGDSGKLSTNLI